MSEYTGVYAATFEIEIAREKSAFILSEYGRFGLLGFFVNSRLYCPLSSLIGVFLLMMGFIGIL